MNVGRPRLISVHVVIALMGLGLHGAKADEPPRAFYTPAQEVEGIVHAMNAFHGASRTLQGAQFRVVTPESILADTVTGPVVEVRLQDGRTQYLASGPDGSVQRLKKELRKAWWTVKLRSLVDGLPYLLIVAAQPDENPSLGFAFRPTDLIAHYMAAIATQPITLIPAPKELPVAAARAQLKTVAEMQSVLERASEELHNRHSAGGTYRFSQWKDEKGEIVDSVIVAVPREGAIYSVRLRSDKPEVDYQPVMIEERLLYDWTLYALAETLGEAVTFNIEMLGAMAGDMHLERMKSISQ